MLYFNTNVGATLGGYFGLIPSKPAQPSPDPKEALEKESRSGDHDSCPQHVMEGI